MVLFAICGYYYLTNLVLTNKLGYNDLYVYSGDSDTYNDHSTEETIIDMASPDELFHSLGTSNLLGMAATVFMAKLINDDNWEYVVLMLNLFILFATLRNYEIIFKSFGSHRYHIFLFLLLMNPLIIVGLANVSKEIWGLFIVSAFLRYRLERSYVRYLVITILSFLIRDVYFAIGVLFLVMSSIKINRLLYLIVISLAIPYVMPSGMIDLLVEGQDEKSIGLAVMMNSIQSYPFGYLIVYVPKLIISAFADLSPLRFFKDQDNIIGTLTTMSSFMSFILTVVIGRALFLKKKCIKPILLDLFFSYTFIVAVTAFIHHRYLFPLYPILPLIVLTGFLDVKCKEVTAVEDDNKIILKPAVVQ